MERLDFASVMAVLRRNVGEECCTNQTDFVYALLRDVDLDPNYAVDFDPGQVCRWLSGLARVSPDIISFYQTNSNQKKLAQRMETDILPMMPDSAMAVQELHDLLLQAPNVSQQKKTELTEDFSFEEENDAAGFITEVLCLAMQLRFEKRDVRHKQLPEPGSLSPRVMDYIFDTDIPRACRWFLGRAQELGQLHRLLTDHSKVFVHGIPGIGKSELAKAYAQQHKKEYTNIIYNNKQKFCILIDYGDDLADFCDDPNCFEVDELIAYPIKLLHEKGYPTVASCAGHAYGLPGFSCIANESCDYPQNRVFLQKYMEEYESTVVCYENDGDSVPYIYFRNPTAFESLPEGWSFANNSLLLDVGKIENPSLFYEKLTHHIAVLTEWIMQLPPQ